jgi:hypothetical protein
VGFSPVAGDPPVGGFSPEEEFFELAAVGSVLLVASAQRLELRDGDTGALHRVVTPPQSSSFQGVAEGRFWFESVLDVAGSHRLAIGMDAEGSFSAEVLLPDDASLLRGSGGRLACSVPTHFDAFELLVFDSDGEVCFTQRVVGSTVAVGHDEVHVAPYGQPIVSSWPLPSSKHGSGPAGEPALDTPSAYPGEILDMAPTARGWVELREATISQRAVGPPSGHGRFVPVATSSDFYVSRVEHGHVVASRRLEDPASPIVADADSVWLVSGRRLTDPTPSPVDLVVLDTRLDEIARWPAGSGTAVRLAVCNDTRSATELSR